MVVTKVVTKMMVVVVKWMNTYLTKNERIDQISGDDYQNDHYGRNNQHHGDHDRLAIIE